MAFQGTFRATGTVCLGELDQERSLLEAMVLIRLNRISLDKAIVSCTLELLFLLQIMRLFVKWLVPFELSWRTTWSLEAQGPLRRG